MCILFSAYFADTGAGLVTPLPVGVQGAVMLGSAVRSGAAALTRVLIPDLSQHVSVETRDTRGDTWWGKQSDSDC